MGVKQVVRALFNRAGLEVTRRRDPFQLAVYEALHGREVLARKPFYNVGAGSFWHPYWTNLDFVSAWYKDTQRDVVHYDIMARGSLPIESGSALIIYTSHTIEHVKDNAVSRMLQEAYRALAPGGVVRVTTGPDAETDYRALVNGDIHWFYWDEMYVMPENYEPIYHRPATSVPLEERWLHHFASALAPNDISPSKEKFSAAQIREVVANLGFPKALDYFTSKCAFDPERPGNHVSWWTHDKVMDFLRQAGFAAPYRSGYGQSVSPLMRNSSLFDSTHPQVSLYVEAVK